MVVQHNLTAMNSNRMLGLTTSAQAKSTERLSSGYKINRAADDAAGLAISEKMRKQIRGLTQASANAQDGISAVQTAEGALTEVHDMLQRMNELAVKSANGTNSEDDRNYIQSEIDALIEEIDRVSTTTKFNETYLLEGDEDAGSKDVYSYKTVTTPASATIKEGATLYQADGTAIADADALALYLKDDPDATVLSDAGTEAVENTDYTKTTTASLKDGVNLYAADGTQLDATSLQSAVDDGDKIYKGSAGAGTQATAAAVDTTGGDGNHKLAVDLYNADGTPYKSANDAVGDDFDPSTYYTTAPSAEAVANTDYTTEVSYEIGADKKVYDEAGKELDAAGLKDALDGGGKVYSTAPTVAKIGDDYTYTAETSGKAKLYDDQGKAVKAADIAAMVEEGKTLYSDKEHTQAATLSDYTTTVAVNADLEFSLHVGADSADDNKIKVTIASMSAAGIGVNGLDVSTEDAATASIDTISDALKIVSKQRSDLGAVQNRLEHTINNLDNVVENTTAAESQIRDTDMATEMVKYSNNNILAQAGQSMLAQANQSNQGVLSLLG